MGIGQKVSQAVLYDLSIYIVTLTCQLKLKLSQDYIKNGSLTKAPGQYLILYLY